MKATQFHFMILVVLSLILRKKIVSFLNIENKVRTREGSRLCQEKGTVPRIIIFITLKKNENQSRQQECSSTLWWLLTPNPFPFPKPPACLHTPTFSLLITLILFSYPPSNSLRGSCFCPTVNRDQSNPGVPFPSPAIDLDICQNISLLLILSH